MLLGCGRRGGLRWGAGSRGEAAKRAGRAAAAALLSHPLSIDQLLPPRPQNMTVEQFRATMAVDKKVQDGKLRLILLK